MRARARPGRDAEDWLERCERRCALVGALPRVSVIELNQVVHGRMPLHDMPSTHGRRGQALHARPAWRLVRALRLLLFAGRAALRVGAPGQSLAEKMGFVARYRSLTDVPGRYH